MILQIKTKEILEVIEELSDGKLVSIPDIHSRIGGSKSAIRTHLHSLKSKGLVDNPRRGMYRVTNNGKEILRSHG